MSVHFLNISKYFNSCIELNNLTYGFGLMTLVIVADSINSLICITLLQIETARDCTVSFFIAFLSCILFIIACHMRLKLVYFLHKLV